MARRRGGAWLAEMVGLALIVAALLLMVAVMVEEIAHVVECSDIRSLSACLSTQ